MMIQQQGMTVNFAMQLREQWSERILRYLTASYKEL
jgi:hypothetical protein